MSALGQKETKRATLNVKCQAPQRTFGRSTSTNASMLSLTTDAHDFYMDKLAVLAFLWAIAFAMLFLPARKVGTWIARPRDGLAGTALSILLCFVLAWGVVLFGRLALVLVGHHVFPPINPDFFGLYYVAVLLFVPAFAALITGSLHARLLAEGRTIVSLLPAKARELLAHLLLLVISVTFLTIGGWSLLKWYETGQIATRYRDVTHAAEPYLFGFAFFRSSLMVVLGLCGFWGFFVLRCYIRPRLHRQRRENGDER
ncbi:hypothetical protein [Bradyrhizobium sp. CCBAU 53421]|uniref:hypothetical protein n=1 Tax=Bradyrhizobium sp. CCBAU 53421 TaxID=1325120 RepID=UPI00188C1855|nr:hypothetical protein [Bradyrhizobium sp. CCBAU 53421]QOZ35614.1 hypothetical protein XH92_31245 [Bradyrhizobium sp. CCBAU 53421]